MKATPFHILIVGDDGALVLIAKRSDLTKAREQAENVKASFGTYPTADSVSVIVRDGDGSTLATY